MLHRLFVLVALLCVATISGCDQTAGQAKGPDAFVDVTKTAFDPAPAVVGWPGIALFDYDNDGDIDVFITNAPGRSHRLYQNDGRGNFVEVGTQAGVRFPQDMGVCVGVGDFDNDGWLDLLIGRQVFAGGTSDVESVRYLKNMGADADGIVRFEDRTEASGLGAVTFGTSIGVGDIDNDGLLDLYIGRYDLRELSFRFVTYLPDSPNVLLHNSGVENGVPRFVDITDSAGVAGTRIAGLDASSEDMLNRMPTWAVYLTDVNVDGLLDIFALQEIPGGVDLFINNGDRTFTGVQEDLLNKHGGWMGITGGDYDRDGDIDYFIANVGADAQGAELSTNSLTSAFKRPNGTPFHMLLENDGAGDLSNTASSVPVEPGILPPTNNLGGRGLAAYEFGFGCAWLDVQNDGWLDLAWTGDLILFDGLGDGIARTDFHGVGRLLIGDGNGGFVDHTAQRGLFNIRAESPLAFGFDEPGRSLAVADLNGDGFQDICRSSLRTSDAFQCLMNPAVETGRWITVRLVGTQSNRFGIGARVEVRASDATFVAEILTTTSAFTAVHPQAHFGIGDVLQLDTISVTWPSGVVTTVEDVDANQIITITEE